MQMTELCQKKPTAEENKSWHNPSDGCPSNPRSYDESSLQYMGNHKSEGKDIVALLAPEHASVEQTCQSKQGYLNAK